jgi:hypothetical protein
VNIYEHTDELRRELTKRGIAWERNGNQLTRWMYKGHVYVADVQEPSGEVFLTTFPHTVADVLKEMD